MARNTFGKGQWGVTVAAAVALLAVSAVAAHAAPLLTERHEDYTVTGRSVVELRGQMDRLGPRSEDGKIYDANTRSELQWSYQYQSGLDGCRIASADIRLSVVYVMPKWTEHDNALRDVRDAWDRYMERLIVHEQGHRDVSMQVAVELERELLEMRGRYCHELGKAADEAGRGKLEVLRMRNRDFDEQTRHGAGQGAVFP
jgi:predicted secreted Zn-dependent protease